MATPIIFEVSAFYVVRLEPLHSVKVRFRNAPLEVIPVQKHFNLDAFTLCGYQRLKQNAQRVAALPHSMFQLVRRYQNFVSSSSRQHDGLRQKSFVR
jgi:hypothetical protein